SGLPGFRRAASPRPIATSTSHGRSRVLVVPGAGGGNRRGRAARADLTWGMYPASKRLVPGAGSRRTICAAFRPVTSPGPYRRTVAGTSPAGSRGTATGSVTRAASVAVGSSAAAIERLTPPWTQGRKVYAASAGEL